MDIRRNRLAALERHIQRLDRRLTHYNRISEDLTRWRLMIFVGGLFAVLVGLAIHNTVALVITIIWIVIFAALVYRHRRVTSTIEQFNLWRSIKQTHIARMRLDWVQLPPESVETPDNHPFAIDLDITGSYSIHRLLDTAVSQGGSERLKNWLLIQRPDYETIRRHQQLVKELIPITMFRDHLTLQASITAGKLQRKWNGDSLLRWLNAKEQSIHVSVSMVWFLGGLAALNILLLLASTAGLIPPLWVITFLIYVLVSGTQWRKLAGLFSEAMVIQSQIRRLRSVFQHLEDYNYANRDALWELCSPFLNAAQRPSAQLRRISVITAAASLQANVILWLALNLLIPWDITFAYLLSRSKGELVVALPQWLNAWYELEAISALATFAYLNPQYTFPTIEPAIGTQHAVSLQDNPEIFSGEQLGHPLIPAEDKVCNDFTLNHLSEVVIITGSNMAGKSSFLRTLGVNLVLAYAGSVTNAKTLHTRLFRLFTCIRVTDSVVDGFSYFYAEVRRLKALLEALRTPDELPLFYLIDEIFRGTNNRERLIGSRSYIRELADQNGVGFIATHDLELVKLEAEIPSIRNVHFREEVRDGRMVFDYVLHPGPSPTTNALKIMQLEGLPVEDGAAQV